MIVDDPFALFFKLLFASRGLVDHLDVARLEARCRTADEGEYYGLVLAAPLGMFFMASATNLLMAYLSLEFVSLTSYVLTGYLRHDRRSARRR